MLNKKYLDTLNDKIMITIILIFTFALLFIVSNMSPTYYSNEWSDVNVYFNIGKAIFNGRTLYTEVFDHKGPLIFFIYGLGYLISNDSFFGVFLIEVLGWFAMSCAIFYLAKLYLNNGPAFLVAISIQVLAVKLIKAGGAAEEFILIFNCISLYYFIKYFKDKNASTHKPYYMLIHGIMCSMVLFTKINLILFWFFPLLGIFINLLLHKEYKNFIINALMFILGVLIIAVPICSYLYVNNALQEAYDVYIELNRKYAAREFTAVKSQVPPLIRGFIFMYLEPFSLALMYFVGIFYFPIKYISNKIGKWVIVLSGISLYVSIYMSTVYQVYYPIPMLVFSALGILGGVLFLSRFFSVKRLSFAVILILSVTMYYVGISQKKLTEIGIARMIVDGHPLLSQKLHDEIIKEKDPTLLILGHGVANNLFTTCNIVPNVRYFFTPNIPDTVYPDLRKEQERYIENKEVTFIVLPCPNMPPDSLFLASGIISDFERFSNLKAMNENYHLVDKYYIVNEVDERNFDIMNLYKRND